MSGWSALSPKIPLAISGASPFTSAVISLWSRTISLRWFCFGRVSVGCWLGSKPSCDGG